MKRLALVLTLVAGALIVALALLLGGPGGSEGAVTPVLGSGSARSGGDVAKLASPPGASAGRAGREALGSGPTEEERSVALWIEGRVEWPEGASTDDVRVVGMGRAFAGGYDAVRVGQDGSFRVAVAPDSRTVRLDVEGPFLVLDPQVAFRADEVPDDLVLRPLLGAHVVGRITLPEGARRAHTIPGEMIHLIDVSEGPYAFTPPVAEAKIRGDLTYDFGVIRAGGPYKLRYEPVGYPEPGFGEFDTEPGTKEHADTWLERGVQIKGRVVSGGATLAGARVAVAEAKVPAFGGTETSGKTVAWPEMDKEGRFAVVVKPGPLRLEVERAGFEPLAHSLGDLQTDVEDLELELVGMGGGLRGIVLDPEGDGVRRAELRVYDADGKDLLEQRADEAKTARDGRFAIQGLGEGPWFVVATARVKSERLGKRERHWVFEPGVQPGADLRLELRPGEVLVGEVVDDRGLSLDRFEIIAIPETYLDFEPFSEESMEKTFSRADGRFRWGDLPAGRSWVYARGDYASLSELVTVTLDGAEEAVRFEIPRRGKVQGRVTHRGQPVSGALVHTKNEGWPQYQPFSYTPLDLVARTDVEGNYQVSAGPGLVDLWATVKDGPESTRVAVELAPGGMEVVHLELGRYGSLEVLLHSALGDIEGRRVRLSRKRHEWADQATLEGERRVAWAELQPGQYDVDLALPYEELRATVEVQAGERASVTFGAPASIEVTGVVRRAGKPVPGMRIRAIAQGSSWSAFHVDPRSPRAEWHKTAADGSYRFMVHDADRYRFELGGRGKASFDHEIPAEGARIDFELATATVGGRVSVLGAAPSSGRYHFEVRMRRRSKPVPGFQDLRYSSVDKEGLFDFGDVPAGRYVLYAQERRDRLGRVAVDVRVEDDEPVELDIELAAACTLRGTVFDAEGMPASGASLRLITRDRNWLTWFADGSVGSDGTFRIEGVGAGVYHLHASDGEAEVESEPIQLVPGADSVIDLRFE